MTKTLEELFVDSILIMFEVHGDQSDKNGDSYFRHPLRVALNCNTLTEKIVAILHDTLEDDPSLTPEILRDRGYTEEIIEALLSVTRQKNENYEDFIRRASKNEIGRNVKIADLKDNSDPKRLSTLNPEVSERLRKRYEAALCYLENEKGK